MGRIALSALTDDLYRQSHSREQTLSMFLEERDPSPEGSKLDAFGRLMQEAGIVTRNIPERNIFSSKVEAFYRTNENKVLFPEFVARTLVHAMTAFPLYNYLVAAKTAIDSNVHKGSYLDFDDADNKKAVEMRRVTEAADLPTARLKLGETAITIYKYGRAIEASYEALRRMSIDLFVRHINRIGTMAADNKVAEILYVIKNGDGNNNAAPVINTSTLDGTATTAITRKAWVKFLLSFYPDKCNTVVANEDGLIQILEVLYPKFEVAGKMDELLANGLTVKTTLPQGLIDNTTLLYSPRIEKINNKEVVIGLDRGNTIEEIFEVGSTISEADTFIKNQTKMLTVSENSGFMKIFSDTSKILSIQ